MYYGGRGIYVCDEWRYYPNDKNKTEINQRNYSNFYNWYMDQLKKLNMSIDQIKELSYSLDRIDVNGPYSPENCRIADLKTQQYNKTNTKYFYYKNYKFTIKDLSNILNIDTEQVYNRLRRNSVKKILNSDIKIKEKFIQWEKANMNKNNTNENTYTKDTVQFYDLKTGIRQKISMYLSADTKIQLTFKGFAEIWLNVIDEFNANRRPHNPVEGWIYLDTNTRHIKVVDNSRGFPLEDDIIERILTSIHSGSKLSRDDTSKTQAYGMGVIGSNGAGLCIVNCTSKHFAVTSIREGRIKKVVYKDGDLLSTSLETLTPEKLPPEIKRIPNYTCGAMVEAILDTDVYGDDPIDIEMIRKEFENISYGAAGLKLHFIVDGKEELYYAPNGYSDLINKTIQKRHLKPVFKTLNFRFDSENYKEDNLTAITDIMLTFCQHSIDQSFSYVNSHLTPDNGTHVSGMKTAITMAMNKYMNDNDKIPKKYAKMDVTGAIINDFLLSVVSLSTNRNLVWSSQSKEKLNDQVILNFIKSKFYQIFLTWLNENPKEADKLIKMILLEAEARYAAKAAKNKVLGVSDNKSFAANSASKRLSDCLCKDPAKKTLYLVEGESASIGSAKDSEYQACYLLRGKVKNVIKSDTLDNEIILDFISILGCGFGDKKDIDKIKYHQIIILADADKDGQHIVALLLGFFYKYYPEVIDRGYLYIGRPPLLKIVTKSDKTFFIYDEKHYDFYLVQLMKEIFKYYSNDIEIPEKLIEPFLYGLRYYKDLIDNFSRQMNIPPFLLENIILYYKDIQNGKYKIFENLGYKINIREENETKKVIDFHENIHHYMVVFDSSFYNEVYTKIFNHIANKIRFYNISIENKETKEKIKINSLYDLSKLMNNILDGKHIKESRRFKGLGEMNKEDLAETCVNPKTRKINRVTMKDAEKAYEIIHTFLGDKFQDKKKEHLEKRM